MSDEAHPHEIIIIKRHGGGHEDGHHGGAWKIAYADFVTAMMAFFLVMWLISANDKTKAVIARYFNPVQLVDSTSQPPGLSDPKDKASPPAPKGSTAAGSTAAPDKPKDGAAEAPPAAKEGRDTKESKPARDAKKEQGKDEGRKDEAGKDEKIVAVPVPKLTRRYERVTNYTDLPEITLQQVEHFFEHYKDLEKTKWVKITGWGDAQKAKAIIVEAMERARAKGV